MAWGILVFVVLLVILGLGARWLFRQRDPSEIRVAREWINALRRKRP